jgi:hypothetical protein
LALSPQLQQSSSNPLALLTSTRDDVPSNDFTTAAANIPLADLCLRLCLLLSEVTFATFSLE